MKAIKGNWEFEGTPKEIKELIVGNNTEKKRKYVLSGKYKKNKTINDKKKHSLSNNYKTWTKKDTDFLIRYFKRLSYKKLAEKLHRTQKAVEKKCEYLKLSKRN